MKSELLILIKKVLLITDQKAFSITEVVLTVALLGIVATPITHSLLFSQDMINNTGNRNQAVLLAQEGLAAVENLGQGAMGNLLNGNHGLVVSNGQWILSGESDTIGIFNRQISISSIDYDTKLINSTVTWPKRTGINETVNLEMEYTNWLQLTSDWSSPMQLTSIDVGGGQDALKIQIQGDYTYFVRTQGSPDFVVVDVADTENVHIEGSLKLPSSPTNIAINGDYAYVASSHNSSQELQIIDISNPASPSLVGSYTHAGNSSALGIYYLDNKVYLTFEENKEEDEFLVIDVSTPSNPSLLGSVDFGSDIHEVYVNGNYAYVATAANTQELQIIDVSNSNTPTLYSSLNLAGNTDGLSIDGYGQIVVLAKEKDAPGDDTVYKIDVSDVANPSLIASFSSESAVYDVCIGYEGAYVWIASDAATGEFEVLDFSLPDQVVSFGIYDVDKPLFGVTYSADTDLAYAVGGDNDTTLYVLSPAQ